MQEKVVEKKSTCTTELCIKIMTWINIFFALVVIGYGIYQLCTESQVTAEKFASVMVPLYLIFFGILLICAEVEWIFMVKYFKFLDNLFGRGVFNFFLATMVLNEIQKSPTDEETQRALRITLSSILSAIGVAYMGLWVCRCGDKSQKYKDHDKQQIAAQKELQTQNLSQPLMMQGAPENFNMIQQQQMQSNQQEYINWLQNQLIQVQGQSNQQNYKYNMQNQSTAIPIINPAPIVNSAPVVI